MLPTEQSKVRDSCQNELTSLKMLLDMVDEVCFVLDQDFIITYVNRHTLSSFEKEADELIGKAFHEIFPYVKAIINLNTIRQNLYGGENVVTEVQSPLSGRSFQVTASGFDNGFLFFMKETTVERRYQQLLHEKDAKLRAVTNAISDFFLIVSPTGRISFATPTARQITGFSPDELENERLVDLVIPEQRQSVKKDFEARLNDPDQTSSTVFSIQHKDGGHIKLHAVVQDEIDPKIDGMILKHDP